MSLQESGRRLRSLGMIILILFVLGGAFSQTSFGGYLAVTSFLGYAMLVGALGLFLYSVWPVIFELYDFVRGRTKVQQ